MSLLRTDDSTTIDTDKTLVVSYLHGIAINQFHVPLWFGKIVDAFMFGLKSSAQSTCCR